MLFSFSYDLHIIMWGYWPNIYESSLYILFSISKTILNQLSIFSKGIQSFNLFINDVISPLKYSALYLLFGDISYSFMLINSSTIFSLSCLA